MRELGNLREEVRASGIKSDLSTCAEKADRIAELSLEIASFARGIRQLIIHIKNDPAYIYVGDAYEG